MLSYEEIYRGVSAVVIEALNLDEEEVKPGATLQGDLGAESIDFMDIVFRLQREFKIKIPRGELFPESIFQASPEFVDYHPRPHGYAVNARGLQELRESLPSADLSEFEKDPRLENVSDLFTVGMLCRYIQSKLDKEV